MRQDALQVRRFTQDKINQILRAQESAARAALANLRRGLGKPPGALPQLWGLTLEGLPEALYSKDGQPSRAEWAVYTALTLFALHQQGKDLKSECMNRQDSSLGKAVRRLAPAEDDLPRVKRRFDAAATADSPAEFAHHLKGLVQLLKAMDIPLDYPALAEDLYFFQYPGARDRVRLRWGQDFYRAAPEDQAGEDNKANNLE